jgi:DNA-binding response OmpR family regulator
MDVPFYFTNFFPMLTELPAFFSGESEVYPEVLIESRNADLRFLLKTSLIIWQYRVIESAGLTDTREIIDEQKPALILLDCDSRFEDALLKIRGLRQSRAVGQIPVIVLSDYSEKYNQELFYAAGANEHLLKPIDFERLASLIDENIRRGYHSGPRSGGLL